MDTKKVTASLEEVLTKLREDLELYYKKLLMQLEAREIKMRPRNLANISDSKVLLTILPSSRKVLCRKYALICVFFLAPAVELKVTNKIISF